MAVKQYTFPGIPEPTADITSILRTVMALRQSVQTLTGDRNPASQGIVQRVDTIAAAVQSGSSTTSGDGSNVDITQNGVLAQNAASGAISVDAQLFVNASCQVDIIAYFAGQPGKQMPVADLTKVLNLTRTDVDGTLVKLASVPLQYVADTTIDFSALPTSKPSTPGTLWNNNGVISVTTGAAAAPAVASGLRFLQTLIAYIDNPSPGNTTYTLSITGGTAQGPLVIQAVERKI